MPEQISIAEVSRWAEAVAGLARTGLAFSDSIYDRERYEELLSVAADMVAATHESTTPEEMVAAWMALSARGVSGYVTPKTGVGAFVGNDRGELLLIKRSDTHRWFFPTGWADVGYSPSEVVIKEVAEECGLEVRPDRLVAVYDGMRAGSPVPVYTVIFACTLLGGELKAHPLECEDIGWFAQDALPQPLTQGSTWTAHAFAAIRGETTETAFDPPRDPVWRTMPG